MADVSADSVDAGGPVETSGEGAVVNIDGTVESSPPVHANARKSTMGIFAGSSVLKNKKSPKKLITKKDAGNNEK